MALTSIPCRWTHFLYRATQERLPICQELGVNDIKLRGIATSSVLDAYPSSGVLQRSWHSALMFDMQLDHYGVLPLRLVKCSRCCFHWPVSAFLCCSIFASHLSPSSHVVTQPLRSRKQFYLIQNQSIGITEFPGFFFPFTSSLTVSPFGNGHARSAVLNDRFIQVVYLSL